MIRVYHLKGLTKEQADRLNRVGWDGAPEFARYANITMRANAADINAAWNAGEYELVASVDTDDLEHAYALTNHIDRSWTENEGVRAMSEHVRSSSVGDVFEHDGKFHAVASFGFDEVIVGSVVVS